MNGGQKNPPFCHIRTEDILSNLIIAHLFAFFIYFYFLVFLCLSLKFDRK
jgi:hypothetical protein